jgi:hypothetical protein
MIPIFTAPALLLCLVQKKIARTIAIAPRPMNNVAFFI